MPWFARNFIVTGNPTFPYFSSVFGRHSPLYSDADYDALAFFASTVPALPITPLGFINGLWKLSFDPRFNSEFCMRFDALFIPGTLAAIVCLFYARSRMTIGTCLVISFAFMVPWFITSQNTRYLVAILPVIAAYSGMSLSIGLNWLRDSIVRSVKTDISLESLMLGVVLVVAPLSCGMNQLQELGRLPCTKSEKTKFLSKVLSTYQAYRFLNELPLGTLYNFADEQMFFFYLDGISMGDFFGQESFSVLQQHANTGETLYAFLRSRDVNYLLVNLRRPRLELRIPKDRFFEKHFDKIFENWNCEVYSIDRFPLQKASK